MFTIIQNNQPPLNDRNVLASIVSTMNRVNIHGLPAPTILFLIKGADSGQRNDVTVHQLMLFYQLFIDKYIMFHCESHT